MEQLAYAFKLMTNEVLLKLRRSRIRDQDLEYGEIVVLVAAQLIVEIT